MNSKEEKFFNNLSLFCSELNKAGTAFEKVNCGKMDAEEGSEIISGSKKKLRNSLIPLLERVYKVYKNPAEARCRKIYAFEERGDEIYKDLIRDLFTGEHKPEYIIYWKEILSETEKMLDATAGSVSLLQRLFTRE